MAGQYSAKEPYLSNITENTLLNGPGTSKETRHFVFNLPKSGMEYKVGDALGVIAENPPHTVEQLLQVTGWDGNDLITGPSGEASLRDVLLTQVEIHRVNKKFIQSLADKITPLAGMVNARIS